MTNVDALLAQQVQHQAAADAAAAQLAEHEAQHQAVRAALGHEWDRELLTSYRSRMRALDEEQKQAQAAFRAAVLETPVVEAWITLRAVRWSKDAVSTSARNAAARLGEDGQHSILTVDYRSPRLLEDLVELADNEAQARGSDLLAEIEGDREQRMAGEPS